MITIIAAYSDNEQIAELHNQYDLANSDLERSQLAQQIYDLTGDSIRAMLRAAARNWALDRDQIDGLVWESLYSGLRESGILRFRRASAQYSDWQPQIQQMLSEAKAQIQSPAAKIWGLLTETTKAAILNNSKYITAGVQNLFLTNLNELIRRRDLYDSRLWPAEVLPEEAQKLLQVGLDALPASMLARFNAILISQTFKGIETPLQQRMALMGYIAKTVIPRMKPQLWSAATGRDVPRHLVEAWGALKDDFAAVLQLTNEGSLPEEWERLPFAEQVRLQHRRRIAAQFGPAIVWMNAQIQRLMPQNAFTVKDVASLRRAKEILEAHEDEIPAKLWAEKGSRYYIPNSAFQLYGIKLIGELANAEGFGQRSVPRQTPALQMQRPAQGNAEKLLAGGHSSRAFRFLIDKLFASPGYEAEFAVGQFLARKPTPNNADIEQFLSSLPDDVADDIRSVGFRNLAREIDKQVLEAVQEPAVRDELSSLVGGEKPTQTTISAIRSAIFIRTGALIKERRAA